MSWRPDGRKIEGKGRGIRWRGMVPLKGMLGPRRRILQKVIGVRVSTGVTVSTPK